jgi:hypothetical protein
MVPGHFGRYPSDEPPCMVMEVPSSWTIYQIPAVMHTHYSQMFCGLIRIKIENLRKERGSWSQTTERLDGGFFFRGLKIIIRFLIALSTNAL